MSRPDIRRFLVLTPGLALVSLAISGLLRRAPTPTAADSAVGDRDVPAILRRPPVEPLPRSVLPARVKLVFTTGLVGNLTHCACGGQNLGGVGRIATVIHRLTSGNGEPEKPLGYAPLDGARDRRGKRGIGETAGHQLLVLDAGGMLEPNFPSPHVQARALGRFLAEAAYDGVNSHQPDLLFPGAGTRNGTEPPVVCANVVDSIISEPVAAPYALKYIGGARVAIVGLASSELANAKTTPPSAFQPASEFYVRQAEQLKGMLKAEKQHGGNTEDSRAVIAQLSSDVDRFENLAGEWKTRAREQAGGGSKEGQLKVTDPLEALRSIMPKLRSECDLVIVLSQCGLSTDREIARTFPNVIVIGGVGATVLKQPEQIGESWVLPTSVQGADVCAVDIEVLGDRLSVIGKGTGGKWGTRRIVVKNFQRHPVNASVPEDPKVLEILEDYFAELSHVAQRTVRQMPAGRRFVGSQKCIDCHEEEGKAWKASKHAHAMDALKEALDLLTGTGRNPQSEIRPGVSGAERNPQFLGGQGHKFPPNRINECYLCHRLTPPEGMSSSTAGPNGLSPALSGVEGSLVTRFSLSAVEGHSPALSGVEGPLPPRLRSLRQGSGQAGQAEGVGCESCHGAGELHAQDARRPIPVPRPPESTCLSCHTPTRSPKFAFAKYWEMIRH